MTEREAAQLKEQLGAAHKKIAQLEETVQALLRRLYGAKSEKFDPAQLQLLLGGDELGKDQSSDGADAPEEDGAANAKTRRKRKKRQGPRWPKSAPIIVEQELVHEEVQAHPERFRELEPEYSDYPDFVPGKFVIRRIVRRKFIDLEDRSRPPLIVPAPVPPIPGTRCAPGLAAHVLMAKYVLHQPLYRVEFEFKTRYEVYLPRQTLDHWVMCCAARLRLVARAIELEVLSAYSIQFDDTPLFYLEPGHGRTRKGAMWVYNDPAPGGSVCYRWHTSRGHQSPEEFFVDADTGELRFEGPLQGDCYSAHDTLAAKYPGLELFGCVAHTRRPFAEALDLGELRYSPLILLHFTNLYAIEKRLRDKNAGPALRKAVRDSESRPILDRLHKTLMIIRAKTLPAGALGKAVAYALKHWEKIIGFLKDGRLEIDTNLVENAIRPLKLGMKNWLFIGSAEAGWVAAVMYTLVENCKRQGLDPYQYLKEVLTSLPEGEFEAEDVAHLTPARVAKAKRLEDRRAAA